MLDQDHGVSADRCSYKSGLNLYTFALHDTLLKEKQIEFETGIVDKMPDYNTCRMLRSWNDFVWRRCIQLGKTRERMFNLMRSRKGCIQLGKARERKQKKKNEKKT